MLYEYLVYFVTACVSHQIKPLSGTNYCSKLVHTQTKMSILPAQYLLKTFSRSVLLTRAVTKIQINQSAMSHAQAHDKQVKYKLTYFDLKALGEPIRWQFILAGVEFEDNRIPRDDWDTQYKHKVGWGHVPVLHIDGKELRQSGAISRYLAKQFNQLADTDIENARCDEIVDSVDDIRLLWRLWLRPTNEEEKKVQEKNLMNNVFPHYLSKMNDALVANGGKNGFAVGDKLTWADLYLANFLEIWTDNHGPQILENCPALRKQKETVFNIPKIKEWVDKRKKTAV